MASKELDSVVGQDTEWTSKNKVETVTVKLVEMAKIISCLNESV